VEGLPVALTPLDYLAAAAAAGAAGGINAIAGGGTLVSFSVLLAVGVAPVTANVTNTVALVPAYLAGSWGQRDDLRPQLRAARTLAAGALVGGLAGSVLLVSIPPNSFRVAAPYLILLACALLGGEARVKQHLRPATADVPQGAAHTRVIAATRSSRTVAVSLAVLGAAVYGGFFGAGLGIMLLAVLGMFSANPGVEVNALKQALSFVINLVAAGFFLFSGRLNTDLALAMAVGGVLGGTVGSRLIRSIPERLLRRIVVLAGITVATVLWAA
jgi:uncharacterized membrane protein YfcA